MATSFTSGPRLSKSRYLAGLQCPRRLFLEVHAPDLATPRDDWSQGLMDLGLQVGDVARGRFRNGALVEEARIPDALTTTEGLLAEARAPAIFEACFEHDGVLSRVDVLERAGDAWRLIEVKSATQVKDEYLDDVAIQVHVVRGGGLPLAGAFVLHLDREYTYPGDDLDLDRLFRLAEVTKEVDDRQAEIPARVAAMRATLRASDPPVVEPTYHCHEPLRCPFWEHCTAGKPARWIFHLPGGRRAFDELTPQGIRTIDEIPAGFRLTAVQRRVKDNVEWIGPGLREALESVRYPVHHLDFETVTLAIPRYPRTRPYQTIPFQWSNHVERQDGSLEHHSHLGTGCEDPREDLALDLLESLGTDGSVCVYSGYEERVLRELASAFPKLKNDLLDVIERLWDLLPVIRGHYYHPAFGGSYSIKSTLPALVPSLGYQDLEIREGGVASLQYYRMTFEAGDPAEKARVRDSLLRYCERDTLAMVELRRALCEKAAAGPR